MLITGGLGFIGSNLGIRLLEEGASVTLVDSLIPEYGGNPANIRGYESRLKVNISDVRDPHSMKTLVKGHDFLFNLAGQTSHMDSMADPYTDLDINCKAQLSILEACRNANPGIRIVFAGTRQIYGKPDYLPVDEKHPVRPVDVNGINKMAGEWYHILYNNVYGIRACSLRLTNTIGPRMRIKDARQTFLGVWIRQVLTGKPFEVWGGEQLRDFTYVDDCVDAMMRAALHEEAFGQIFNIGGGKRISLRDLADLLVDTAGEGAYEVREYPADRKKIDIGDYYADDSRLRSLLGWEPRTQLRDGLRQIIDYYRPRLQDYSVRIAMNAPLIPQANPGAAFRSRRDALLKAADDVLDGGWYINGKQVRQFEESFAAFCSVKHAVGVGNGTDAIEVALRALGIGKGGLVFTVSHTAVATVAAIECAGATPVLVDVDPVTYYHVAGKPRQSA